MTLRHRILRIAADLPKGHETRRRLLAVLKEGSLPRPPLEVVNLFQNLISDGSLRTRLKAKDLPVSFLEAIVSEIVSASERTMSFVETDGMEEAEGEYSGLEWVPYSVEWPTLVYFSASGFFNWLDAVRIFLEWENLRGDRKQIAVRLAGSGAWLKYLKQAQTAMESAVNEELPENVYFKEEAEEEAWKNTSGGAVDDEYQEGGDVGFEKGEADEGAPDSEVLVNRKGVEWYTRMSYTISEPEAVSGTLGQLTDAGERQQAEDARYDYLESKGRDW